ncbi:Cohesin subunit SA-3 [Galdieria sulphuraria]|nr:Cohesin subunit SA-3 [Galdieria sulphuraria]
MVVLRGRNVETPLDQKRSENASYLVKETIEEDFEEASSQGDSSSSVHESQSEDSENNEAQENETSDVNGYSPPSSKKRKIGNISESNSSNDIVTLENFENRSSNLFVKLQRGIDGVNALLRTLFEEISLGKETDILKDLYSLIYRTAFFPNASNWPEALQKKLSEFLANWDMSDASLEKMLMTFDENILSARLCLTLKDKASKRFRSRYEAFWKNLAKIAPRSLIHNQSFFNCLVDQLSLFTSSNFRNLRFVAALSCFSLSNGFISSEESAKSEHSLFKTHEAKSSSKQRTSVSSSEKATNLTSIAEYLDKIFNKVFVLRYRDVAPEIRALSISYLGEWILNLPRSFLDDRFLKYVGWMLNDKASEVRMSSVHVVANLLRIQENWPRMQLFLRRFRSRICEMTQDKDIQVAQHAVQVMELMMQVGSLTDEEKNILFKIVATETRKPVQEAAQSITNQIVKDLTSHDVSNIDSATRNESSETLIRLARLFSDEKLRNTFLSNCIESLCKEISVLQDWEAYFTILRSEQNDFYSYEEKSIVTKILLELAQNLSSKMASVSSSFHNKSKRIRRQQTNETSKFQQLCRSILNNIISCLTYNQADPVLLTFVVPLIRQVDEDTYRLYCIPESIRDIATKLKELIERHSSSFLLLSECLLSLRHLTQFSDYSFKKEAEEVFSQLSNEIVSSLRDLASAFDTYSHQRHESTRKISTIAISSTLLKALAFITYGSEIQEGGLEIVLEMCQNAETLISFLESESCVLSFLRLAHFCSIQSWHRSGKESCSINESDCYHFEKNMAQLFKLQDCVCQDMLFIDQSCNKLLLYINVISCLQLFFFVKSRTSKDNSSNDRLWGSVLTSLSEKCSIFFIENVRDFTGSNASKPLVQKTIFEGSEDIGMFHFFRCYAQVSEFEDFPSPFRCLSFSLLAITDPNIQSIGKRWLKRANHEDIARGLLEYLRHFPSEVKQLKTISSELSHRFIRIDQLQELASFISFFLSLSLNIDENYKVAVDSVKNATDHILIPLAPADSTRRQIFVCSSFRYYS